MGRVVKWALVGAVVAITVAGAGMSIGIGDPGDFNVVREIGVGLVTGGVVGGALLFIDERREMARDGVGIGTGQFASDSWPDDGQLRVSAGQGLELALLIGWYPGGLVLASSRM